jgi:glutaredoxin
MQAAAERVRVFWQPGCTSCLRTKEFLTRAGVDYESINVHGNAQAMAELAKLGARSVPSSRAASASSSRRRSAT